MNLKLITLSGEKLNREIYEVIIPTIDGEISVFPDHEPLVTVAKAGVVAVQFNSTDTPEQRQYYAISGGVVTIDGKNIKILVDEADSGEDIAEAEAKAALERAYAMRDNAADEVELEKAHQLIDRHVVRLRVADLHRRHRLK